MTIPNQPGISQPPETSELPEPSKLAEPSQPASCIPPTSPILDQSQSSDNVSATSGVPKQLAISTLDEILKTRDPVQEKLYPMEVPIRTDLKSKAQVHDYVFKLGMSQGFVIVIPASKMDSIDLRCDCSGKYISKKSTKPGVKHRETGTTRKTNCPFSVYSKWAPGGWIMRVRNKYHNHPPEKNLVAHPMARRFTKEQMDLITHMTNAGLVPSVVERVLLSMNPKALFTYKDVSNAQYLIRKRKREEEASVVERQEPGDKQTV